MPSNKRCKRNASWKRYNVASVSRSNLSYTGGNEKDIEVEVATCAASLDVEEAKSVRCDSYLLCVTQSDSFFQIA